MNIRALLPQSVAFPDEHTAVSNREDVNFVIERFVDDSAGGDHHLMKSSGFSGDGCETLERHNRIEFWKESGSADSDFDFLEPFDREFVRESNFQFSDDIVEKLDCLGSPNAFHLSDFRCSMRRRRRSRVACMIRSFGTPFPSVHSRREISISRDNSTASSRLSKSSALTGYEAGCPFRVTRMGRCVFFTREMSAARLFRHSENGATSSEERQRRIGNSRIKAIDSSASREMIEQYLEQIEQGFQSRKRTFGGCELMRFQG